LGTSVEIIEPKQSIRTTKRLYTSRINGIYKIDDADLGVHKLDKYQILYSMFTIREDKAKWDERVSHMEHRLRDSIMPHLEFPVI
jgi:hypothetical protein